MITLIQLLSDMISLDFNLYSSDNSEMWLIILQTQEVLADLIFTLWDALCHIRFPMIISTHCFVLETPFLSAMILHSIQNVWYEKQISKTMFFPSETRW